VILFSRIGAIRIKHEKMKISQREPVSCLGLTWLPTKNRKIPMPQEISWRGRKEGPTELSMRILKENRTKILMAVGKRLLFDID
jgi:hypothetical protein